MYKERMKLSDHLLFILGAPDPEMENIITIFQNYGLSYAFATLNGRKIGPSTAYDANGYGPIVGDERPYKQTAHIFVECSVKGIEPIKIIDHHRLGDFGYGRPPAEFWIASSIGQIWNLLYLQIDDQNNPPSDIPNEYLYSAAADHCLSAAYRNECPGILPEKLLEWRMESRSKFQRIPVEELYERVIRAQEVLKQAPKVVIGDEIVADLTGCDRVDELPEASCILRIPFLYSSLDERTNRIKYGLMGATPHALSVWMESKRADDSIEDVYGDPIRGFAGAYLKRII